SFKYLPTKKPPKNYFLDDLFFIFYGISGLCTLFQVLDRFYVGSTSDLEIRMEFHCTSPGPKFTGKAKDWEVFLNFSCQSKNQALAVEKHIKTMKSKKYIQNLKTYPEMVENLKRRFC
ncbi:GIY-YIG nuclease family protein, partial [Salinimicrobium sp. WS361]|uniref:GIY-YIG nuclease family protein n=1 Tax=Salinimicrobium sp. WS361 TaxID=3425123 RepID=UPI003D6FBA6F